MSAARSDWARGGLVLVGVSHHTAHVDLREKLALDLGAWQAATRGALPAVVLSTCNRVEVYAWGPGRGLRTAAQLERALARATGVAPDELHPRVYVRTGREALVHLVRVVAGLDSLVRGEEQIRGQVRDAHRLAATLGGIPAQLDGIFHRAFEAARRVRGGTALGRQPSVAAAAVEVARRMPDLADGGFHGKQALVLGAGAMAKAAARSLVTVGGRVVLVNRTPAHAHHVALQLGAGIDVRPLDDLPALLETASLVVGATASRHPVLTHAAVAAAVERRQGRPLVVLDVAVPRDVEPEVRELPTVRLLDLDDLEKYCPIDSETRRAEVARAESLSVQEADKIGHWLRVRAAGPAIVELRSFGEEVRAHELKRAAGRLAGLTAEQQVAVEALTNAIVNKLLHGPTLALRQAAAEREAARSGGAVLEILRPPRPRHRRA